MKRVFIVGVVLALATGGIILASKQDSQGRPVYLTAAIERGKVVTSITATGRAKAVITVDVGSQLSGQIDELYVDFNDEVGKDQPLARIDQRSFIAKVRESEAALEAARSTVLIQVASVERARSHLASVKARVNVLRAQRARAKTTREAAELDLNRIEQLRKKGAAAQRQLDQARTARDAALALLREAEAENTVHAQEIETAKADLKRAEAELLNARAIAKQKEAILTQSRVELEQTVIRSPIRGVVIGRNIDRGQTVAASLEAPTLFKIAQDLREMEVHAKIDEADIGRIRVGQVATFRVDAFPKRQFSGQVKQIRRDPDVVKNVVTYTIVLSTPNSDLFLLPGMTAIVRIVIRETDNVLKLPNAALRFHPKGSHTAEELTAEKQAQERNGLSVTVWVLGNGYKPRPVSVRLGLSDNTMTEISQGSLHEGQKVVVGIAPGDGKRRLFGLRLGF